MADNDAKTIAGPETPGVLKGATVEPAALDKYMKNVRGIADYTTNNDRMLVDQTKLMSELQKDVLEIEKELPRWKSEYEELLKKAEKSVQAAEVVPKHKAFLEGQELEIKRLKKRLDTEQKITASGVRGRQEAVQDYVTTQLKVVEWKGDATPPAETPGERPKGVGGFDKPSRP